MKKRTTLLLAGLLSVSMLASCGKTPNSGFSGTYWLENHAATNVQASFYEKIEYNVSCVEPDGDLAPKLYEITENYLNFIVDEEKSSYVTELYSENGLYVYKTTLTINGEYVFGESSYKVENDVTETITKFKGMDNGFACVESVKKVRNIYPNTQTPTTADDFTTLTAEFKTVYGEKSATVTATPKDSASKNLLVTMQEPVTVKKYNKKAYMDNELMLLLFRNFDYDNSLSYTFKTIDCSTGTLKEISGAARLNQQQDTTNQSAVRAFTIKDTYIENISNYRISDAKFNCFGVTFKTTGEYSQEFAYAYYAQSVDVLNSDDSLASHETDTRHYMVKCYRPAIYNIGYMVYTIDRVTHQR